jgi:hypothetical protein
MIQTMNHGLSDVLKALTTLSITVSYVPNTESVFGPDEELNLNAFQSVRGQMLTFNGNERNDTWLFLQRRTTHRQDVAQAGATP